MHTLKGHNQDVLRGETDLLESRGRPSLETLRGMAVALSGLSADSVLPMLAPRLTARLGVPV